MNWKEGVKYIEGSRDLEDFELRCTALSISHSETEVEWVGINALLDAGQALKKPDFIVMGLRLFFQRRITPGHWKTLFGESGESDRDKFKEKLRDSICIPIPSLKCSYNCMWFSWCDECDKPFCMLSFEDVINMKKVVNCKHDYIDVCEDCHHGCPCEDEDWEKKAYPKKSSRIEKGEVK